MHNFLKLKMALLFSFLVVLWLTGIAVLNTITLLISRSCLCVAQASSSYKCLDRRTPVYATPTFIAEALCLATYVQLFYMTVKVK